jgi:hypothetical protein
MCFPRKTVLFSPILIDTEQINSFCKNLTEKNKPILSSTAISPNGMVHRNTSAGFAPVITGRLFVDYTYIIRKFYE